MNRAMKETLPWTKARNPERRRSGYVQWLNEQLDAEDREHERRFDAASAHYDWNEDAVREAHPTYKAYLTEQSRAMLLGIKRGQVADLLKDLKRKANIQKNIAALSKLLLHDLASIEFALNEVFAKGRGNKSGKARKARPRAQTIVEEFYALDDGLEREMIADAITIYKRIREIHQAHDVRRSRDDGLPDHVEIAVDRLLALTEKDTKELAPDTPQIEWRLEFRKRLIHGVRNALKKGAARSKP